MSVLIPISFARGEIVKEIDTAHCLQAEALQKESLMMNQEMTKVVMPVLTPDRVEKRQNGRRFKEDGEPEFTLTSQDIHGVAFSVSGKVAKESEDVAHCLNASDQRKIFGAHQNRTMVGEKLQPEVIGGYGNQNFGKQYRQGNRVYDGTKIATALESQPVGNLGGQSNLYSVPIDSSEPLGVLRSIRSDYGKEIRKDYESGNFSCSRHDFLEHEIRDDNISNTIDTVQKDNLAALKIKEATGQGYALAHEGDSINVSMPNSQTRRGRIGRGVAQTLDTSCNQGTMVTIPSDKHESIYVEIYPGCSVYAVWYEKYKCYIAIRKLTPKECFRLQGWDDEYFERARFVNSDSQLYKQAGNGVTVNVVYEIGKRINAG